MPQPAPIGVFDSGYGGLTVLRELVNRLPQYDYLYLGDNARSPYGTRSFETVYQYTLECVKWFFEKGCSLVILACNTASAKALRTIQQNDLPKIAPDKKVLGVIRPTTEAIGNYSQTNAVGILATSGTVASQSYPIEIAKFFPEVEVYQEACPIWVPLIENNEINNHGSAFFIRKNLHSLFQKGKNIDTVLLACTHYPIMQDQIREYLPVDVKLLSQGAIVAESLADYLQRHPEIEALCSKTNKREFYTTDATEDFDNHATLFFWEPVRSNHVDLENSGQ
ncbi:MAG: glutamate racemase [Sphingobacteriales bacterium 41-5]|nr:MAG: glutamate racemase [Sphingobacteriales bacterium 41-5]